MFIGKPSANLLPEHEAVSKQVLKEETVRIHTMSGIID
jgi:hypothetical protein